MKVNNQEPIMAMYRCYNCIGENGPGVDFEGTKPACPKCKLDTVAEPRFKARIIKLSVIHFDPPHPLVRDAGLGKPACGAERGERGMMTGEPIAVTCPACKEHDSFKKAYQSLAVDPEDDFEITKDFIPK